jgi:hypothetical protein
VLQRIKPMLAPRAVIRTDSARHYPAPIKRVLPDVEHQQVLSRRARSIGQGELKKGFDAIFSLNHTAAMIRDCTSRTVRRTWATSKRMDRLETHLLVYARHHNLHRLKVLPAGA